MLGLHCLTLCHRLVTVSRHVLQNVNYRLLRQAAFREPFVPSNTDPSCHVLCDPLHDLALSCPAAAAAAALPLHLQGGANYTYNSD